MGARARQTFLNLRWHECQPRGSTDGPDGPGRLDLFPLHRNKKVPSNRPGIEQSRLDWLQRQSGQYIAKTSIYARLAQRLHRIPPNNPTPIRWEVLYGQFGQSYTGPHK